MASKSRVLVLREKLALLSFIPVRSTDQQRVFTSWKWHIVQAFGEALTPETYTANYVHRRACMIGLTLYLPNTLANQTSDRNMCGGDVIIRIVDKPIVDSDLIRGM